MKVVHPFDSGTKYLKDSIGEDDEFRQLENEFSGIENDDSDEDDDEPTYNYERKSKRFSGSKTSFISALDFGINNYLEDGKYPDDNNQQYTVRPLGLMVCGNNANLANTYWWKICLGLWGWN